MRAIDRKDGFSLHAISGTRAVMLAMNARQDRLKDFLGFGVGMRRSNGNIAWLNGFKVFEAVEPNPGRGQRWKTVEQPIQDFKWGHYSADPATKYTYVVRPLFRPQNGDLSALRAGTDLEVDIRTESEDSGRHTVLFNRGAIVSQAYASRFDNDENLTPEELKAELNDPASKRTQWLSRGLLEGALAFIAQATGSRFSLHCCFYELTYDPVIKALADAAARGATVEATYEAGHFMPREGMRVDTSQSLKNFKAISPYVGKPRLHFRERINFISITHNKFMVLCENGKPIEVWTGSTNITPSGFCGQSNTGHIVRDEAVAKAYFAYFQVLARDEERNALKTFNESNYPNPPDQLDEDSVTTIFSPRRGASMLDWYGGQMNKAEQAIIFTSAFGVSKDLATYFDNDRDYLRYILMEQASKGEGVQEMVERDVDTRVVFGQGLGTTGTMGHWQAIPGWKLENWMRREEHFRREGNIFFVHTKYMAIDPLSDDPRVFTGSANFSPSSLTSNDENMLLIRGDKRVADIYLTEFFRLLNHYYFRQVANRQAEDGESDDSIRFLVPDDSWVAGHFRQQNYRSKRRELFGVAP